MHRALLCCILLAAPARAAMNYGPANVTPPAPPREFRGAWVASVHNIDWPSKPGLPTAQQQAELLAILDRAQQLHLNAVLLQVRPACDALYSSKLEPWSEYLSGVMGKAPSPWWDPLEFAVAESHKRGIELHAWINPFRARHSTGFSPISRDHVSKTHPTYAKVYGSHLWLDPGLPEVHDYSMRVILDIVKRYEIDGIHIDDYFYPYRETNSAGKVIPFPDWTSWNIYLKYGGKLSKEDWRRENVNRFVARMYRDVKAAKPWLKVGISPFGIYRPGFPQQIKGFDQYDALYADPRAWLQHGWLDYLTPQLYWPIDPPAQSFPVLLNWWTQANPRQRLIFAGLNTSALAATATNAGAGPRAWPVSEIINQIGVTRSQPGCSGHIHWNMGALMRNRGGIADQLVRKLYANAALTPALPGSSTRIVQPVLKARVAAPGARAEWAAGNRDDVGFWLVQTKNGGTWRDQLVPKNTSRVDLKFQPEFVSVRAVDKFGRLGPNAAVVLAPEAKGPH